MKFWHVYRHWRVCSLVLASFSISLPSSKLPSSLISIYKHYAFDIAEPGSMQDMCHMNFVIDLAHRGVSVAQWQSIGARNPKVWDSIPHGYSEFFLCPTLVTRRKKHLSLVLACLQVITITQSLWWLMLHRILCDFGFCRPMYVHDLKNIEELTMISFKEKDLKNYLQLK